ncbi:exocyst subunit exo70 family protein F1 [Zostera marina]|uniref:Exocyst subunit Exo70 family protein n=1 Tax=Zostera marina TaxID=29655 RepID=A0A0K9P726_ZOSMR|nr:exocyst subunit exo70 family protein F1 [Zostera marina]
MAAVDGQDRLIETAQQIVKSLGTSKNMTDDMIKILSTFDNRFSRITNDLSLSESNSTATRIDTVEKIILHWDAPNAGFLPFDGYGHCKDDAFEYLAAVDEILNLTEDRSGGVDGEVRDRAETLLQIAMTKLEDELRHVMVVNAVPLDSDNLYGSIRRFSSLSFASDGGDELERDGGESPAVSLDRLRGGSLNFSLAEDVTLDLVRPEAVDDLRQIVDRMIRSTYEKECCQVYSSVRRDFLDECLMVLGVERMSLEDVQKVEWKILNDMMKKWSQSVKVVIAVILVAEKQLCDSIFGDSRLFKEVCFTETAKGCVKQLLNFAEAIAIGHRSSEKLFRILTMYDALSDVGPDLQILFGADSLDSICVEAEGILHELGDAAKGTFVEFENQVKNESSRKLMPGGEIHPVTRYVMNYIKLAVDYSGSLNALLEETGGEEDYDDQTGDYNVNDKDGFSGSMSPLGRRLRMLISYLEMNLEEKSKLYEDRALKYIFLMNNILYIVKKVKDSDIRALLGDQWIRRRRGLVRQYSTGYLRASWTKVLACLRDEGIGGGGGGSVSKVALKERFKNFNVAYDEIYRIQSTWKVPDPQLREELRIQISEMVIPAYRSFLGRYAFHLEGVRHVGKYIKYTLDDLESHVTDLFEGSSHLRRKSSS